MKQVTFSFNPFSVSINNRAYKNISAASKKRLDSTLVDFCKNGQMEMSLYTDFNGNRILSFETIEGVKND